MDELTIEPGYLRSLILRIRALMAKEDTVIPDDGGNATDDAGPGALQETAGDLNREEILEEESRERRFDRGRVQGDYPDFILFVFLCNTYEIRIYILTSRTRGMQVTVR